MQEPKPKILQAKRKEHEKELRILFKKPYVHVIDDFEEQLKELFLARNPKLKTNPQLAKEQTEEFIKKTSHKKNLRTQGVWVYFPWNNTLVHILDKEDFFELRSARNRNLITKKEQKKLREFRIGIAGLSVGNSAAAALALEGAETLRLGDFDELSLSNLNRVRGSITQLGLNKTEMTARHVYELNPYAKLSLFQKGIAKEKDFHKFIAGPPKLNLLIDEIDDVILKIQLRLVARKLRIPVLSVADNGTNAICDIERFDIQPNRKIFHGAIKNIETMQLEKLSFGERIKLINDMVGVQYVTSRMKESVLQVGNTLYSWPQLGGAAMLSGATIAFVVKQIAFGQPIASGKYDVNFERIFDTNYDSPKSKQHRTRETEEFLLRQNRLFANHGRKD